MEVTINTKGLDQLAKALKENTAYVKLGVLSDKTTRKGTGETNNAEIAVKHEFGDPSENLPIRSIFREPLADHFEEYMTKAGAFDQRALKQIIKDGSMLKFVKKIGIIGENIVSDGFSTGGFGKWKPSIMAFKNTKQTLVETHQLEQSITSEVVDA